MRLSLFSYLVLFLTYFSYSQTRITGKLVDEQNNPVPYSLLGLLKQGDSSLVKGTMSSDSGSFVFENIAPGNYFVKITATGYVIKISDPVLVDSLHADITLPSFQLVKDKVQLDEVAIVAIKKPLEFKNGNIIVNVEGSPLASGNSVYDLLMRLPGVVVDGDNISLRGKGGVRFLIDDRLQPFTGQQLISLLKSIHASTVERIELINNPPVKYDASGSGGLINIVTKKVKITGFSGSLMNSSSQGFYANSFTQLSLNYKAKKFSVFSHFNAFYGDFRSENDWTRWVSDGQQETVLSQHYVETSHNRFVSGFLGADWYIDKKNTLSVRVDERPGKDRVMRTNKTAVSDSSLGYRNLLFYFDKPNTWLWQDYSLNLEHLFDTAGTKLTLNGAYSIYPDTYWGQFENHYLDGNYSDVQQAKYFKSENQAGIELLALKGDFEKTLSKTLKLEAGAKTSWQNMNSDFVFENYDPVANTYTLDPVFTNAFRYNERISAGYAELKKEIKKLSIQAGLRAEHTDIKAKSETNSVDYKRNYLNFFPTLSFNYNRSDKHNFQLSYNRRINRADYNKFNPYPSFRSILTTEQGNPYLNPMYTQNFQFVYSYKSKIVQTFEYSRMTNYFLSYYRQNNVTKELIFYTGNLKNADRFMYELFIQHDVKRWWSTTLYANGYYNSYSGNIDGVNYSAGLFSSYAGSVNQLSLSKNTKLEVTGWVIGPWLDAVSYTKSRGGVNFGVRQMFYQDKLSISLGVYDLLYTNRVKSTVNYADQRSESVHRWDSRRVYLNLNYSFGKVKVEQKNLKEDEQKSRLKK